MNIMRKYCLVFILVFLTNTYSQNNHEVQINYGFSIKNYYGKDELFNSLLIFNSNNSIFFFGNNNRDEIIEKDEKDNDVIYTETDSIGTYNYLDLASKSLYSRFKDFGNIFVTKEVLYDFNWQLTNEVKNILNYACVKATTSFRGRKYTAWFTYEIQYSFGPWKLNGLPGLILEAYDDDGKVHFYAREILKTNYHFEQNFTKVYLLNEYNKMISKHLEDNDIIDNNDYLEKAYEF